MRAFRIGVVGLGDISDVYVNNLKKYPDIVQVTAVAARRAEVAAVFARRHAITKNYATGYELIADPDVDIVLNLTPPDAHRDLNLAALAAGKHVYTEKPLGATFEEGCRIIELAARKGLRVASAPDTFLGGRLQTCRRLIDDGTLGRVIGAGAFVADHGHEWFHPNPDFFYQPGAGPLHDIGPYYLTAMLSLFGPIVRCCGMTSRAFNERTIESEPFRGTTISVNVDTHMTGTYEFANGALATILASFDVWDSELPRLEIYGTKGTICLNDIDPIDGPNLFGGNVLLRTRENYRWKDLPRPQRHSDWTRVPIEHRFNEVSQRENSRGIGLVDLALAIRNNRPERASGAMALHSLEAMDALLTSARERRFYDLATTFDLPEPLPVNFPDNER